MNKPAIQANRPLDHNIDEILSKQSIVTGKTIVENFRKHRPSVVSNSNINKTETTEKKPHTENSPPISSTLIPDFLTPLQIPL